MGIRDKPIAPAVPWQNGFAERLIGSIRRECVDHLVVHGEAHLRRILQRYADYYNKIRTHRSLDKDAPVFRSIQRVGSITLRAILGGLHHQYVRIYKQRLCRQARCQYACCKYFQLAAKNASMLVMLVVSIILEAAVAVIAVLAARAGRPYLYGLAFTFAAYVLYDLARMLQWPVEGPLLSGLFLLATITALAAVWGLYWERRGK
jgi:hypothetical protein